MVVNLQDACFFLVGIVAGVWLASAGVRRLLRAEWNVGYQAARENGDRETALRTAIDYRGHGNDPGEIVDCAEIFKAYLLDEPPVQSAARRRGVAD